MMKAVTERPGYKFVEVLFSKTKPFTVEEIKDELKSVGINGHNRKDIEIALKKFRDKGIIVEHGSGYSLDIRDF